MCSSDLVVWAEAVGGIGADVARAVAVDIQGNFYVGGEFTGQVDFDPGPGTRRLGSSGGTDGFLMKLKPDGQVIWTNALGSTGDDRINALTVDLAGNVVVAGSFSGTVDFDFGPELVSQVSSGGLDGFVASYDGAGAFRWARRFGGAGEDRKSTRLNSSHT